jgi:hypothetical protein
MKDKRIIIHCTEEQLRAFRMLSAETGMRYRELLMHLLDVYRGTRADLAKLSDDPEVFATICENIDMIIDAGTVIKAGGPEADQLRETVRQLKINVALKEG